MKIKELCATAESEIPTSGTEVQVLSILADDGKALFNIHVNKGELQIFTGPPCEHEGQALEREIVIRNLQGDKMAIRRTPGGAS